MDSSIFIRSKEGIAVSYSRHGSYDRPATIGRYSALRTAD